MNRPAVLAVMLALSVLVVAFAAFGVDGPVRLVTVLAFAFTAPGAALVSWWRSLDTATAWLAAIASSLSIVIVLAMLMVAIGAWYPVPAMSALAVVTGGALGVQLWRGRSAVATPGSSAGLEVAAR